MAQPSAGDVHINVPLTNLSIAYQQSADNFIADKVFPTVPVPNRSNVFYQFDRDAFFRSDAEKRAPGTEAARTGYTLNANGTYFCEAYSVGHDVDDQTRANADSMLSLDRESTMLVTNQLLIQRENSWVSRFFGTGVWGTDLTGVTGAPTGNQFKMWDQSGSTPIEDVQLRIVKIAEQTGQKPNVLVLSPYVANSLMQNPEIIDRVKYTQPGFLNTSVLATAFGVDKILVPYATNNTAHEGAPGTYSMSFIYGKSALLAYSAPAPGLMTVSAGYTFEWMGYAGLATKIKKYRVETIESDRIEGTIAYDMKVVASDLGCFFSGCVS